MDLSAVRAPSIGRGNAATSDRACVKSSRACPVGQGTGDKVCKRHTISHFTASFYRPDPVLSSECQDEKNPDAWPAGVSSLIDENEGLEGRLQDRLMHWVQAIPRWRPAGTQSSPGRVLCWTGFCRGQDGGGTTQQSCC